ncbi:MAG TPA: hypothetical protein VKB12_14070 [Pyrinomonadaceae bacterium]|nr:hypothetical protein [Pyrinomonadaceae bacterium]
MNTKTVILSCAGTLMVILNRPVGKALRWWHKETGGAADGEWAYRAPLILIGLLLTCLSFEPD